MATRPTALIADDEPLLREAFARQLALAWPELEIVAEARNGREAVQAVRGQTAGHLFSRRADAGRVGRGGGTADRPPRAPGVRHGLRPLRRAGLRAGRARLPREAGRARSSRGNGSAAQGAAGERRSRRRTRTSCCASSRSRLQSSRARRARNRCAGSARKWARRCGSSRPTTSLTCARTASTRSSPGAVTTAHRRRRSCARRSRNWRRSSTRPQFVQVHRSAIVNLRAIDHVRRGDNETPDIHLKDRPEVLPVSRNFLHHFKQM